MSQFAEDASASYLKKAKSNSFAFYAKMENKPVVALHTNNTSHANAPSLPHTATVNNNNNNNNNSSLHKTLAAFYNHAPPSLPRNFLPPLELSERISSGFDLARNRVLEIRMLLSKFNEEEIAQQKRQQNDAINCVDDENEEIAGLNRKERRRRQRELEEQRNNNNNNNNNKRNIDAGDQRNNNGIDKSKKSDNTKAATFATINYSKLSLVEATARRIFSEKTSINLFQSGIVPQSKEFDISKWIAFLFHDSMTQMLVTDSQHNAGDVLRAVTSNYSSDAFRLQPKSTVSLIARLTPGMSNALVEAICSKFSKIANSRETVRFSVNANDETKINNSNIVEICVEPINLPENTNNNNNNNSMSSSPMMGIRTLSSSSSSNVGKTNSNNNNNPKVVEGLIRFLALLRHSGLGCWLYSALCGVELPLSTAVRGCLQEILRICCTSLKTLFEVRPDLLNKVSENIVVNADEKEQQNDQGSKFVISNLPPPLEIEETSGNNNKNTKSSPSFEIKIQANGIDFLALEDARALITIIVLVGKCFHLANPALLPL